MNDRVLEIERLIPASPERVFEYWTEPDLLAKWFGPTGYEVPGHDLDVRAGGKWRATIRSPEGKLNSVSGVYNLVDRPRRLVFTWAWDDDNGRRGEETEVTITLEPTPGGTRLKLVQQPFPTRDMRDRHNGGWTSSLNNLTRVVAQAA
jgi:uncharacterized protein YndB with AHSA1/START domain